ncbi:MAG: hypothetical protein U0736_26515 [Gemmataceae bacterium]
MRERLVRLLWLVPAALAGFIGGCLGGSAAPRPASKALAEYAPLPHHVPQFQGGLALRFAMVHDVLHERFARHGVAHYRERDRVTRARLTELSPDDPASFPLADDLAAGLDRLGRPAEAVPVMRDKLARQLARGMKGRELYTSYANLGTFLIHSSYAAAIAGNAEARGRFREGVELVRKSVEVNPDAHFGRERWQVAVAEFLRAAMDRPDLLRTFDCLGNRLDLAIERTLDRERNWFDTGYGRPTDAAYSQGTAIGQLPDFFRPGVRPDDPDLWHELQPVRRHVMKIGAENGWEGVAAPSHRRPVPFDEPVLGIIGMWRQGGGANPHFALALGETMLRVGQRYIAWAAFERAYRLADRSWPDPAVQQFLREHCRRRQTEIETTLTYQSPAPSYYTPWQHVSPPPARATVENLRSTFEAELAFGEDYQRAYQRYEEEKIKAGVPIAAPAFFDAFQADREPVASRSGPEEWFAYVPAGRAVDYTVRRHLAWGAFGAGLAAMATALLMRPRAARAIR